MANEKHLLLTWGGDYTDTENSAEIWQNSLRLVMDNGTIPDVGTVPNSWSPVAETISRTETDWTITGNWRADFGLGQFFNPDDYLNDQVAPALDTWLGVSGFSDKIRLKWAKLFPIGPNGKAYPAPPYSQGTPCLLEWTSAYPTGDDGANLLPLQNAMVVSHRTSQTGRKGRGRLFRAGPSTNANDAHGAIGSTYVNNALAAQIAFLEAVALNLSVPDVLVIRPAVIGSPWTGYGVINQVRVGNRMDTQRRRRDALTEAYTSDTPTYP